MIYERRLNELSIVKEVEIVLSNFFKKILSRAFFSEFSDFDLSRTVIRVMEEKGVILSRVCWEWQLSWAGNLLV